MAGWRNSLRRLWRELRVQRANYHARELLRLCAELGLSLEFGTHPLGGSRKPSASTTTKEHGAQRQATGTGAGFNSSFRPGGLSAVSLDPTLPARVNSYTVPGVFTVETETRGANGAPPGRVV